MSTRRRRAWLLVALAAQPTPPTLTALADEHGAELVLHPDWRGPVDEVDAAFFVGAPIPAERRFLSEAVLLRRILLARRPLLAIGTAAQLLAVSCGGRTTAALDDDRGPSAVLLTDAGCVDRVLGAGPSPLPVFSWRPTALELPATARPLAISAFCGQQAFRIGRHAYGLQFHPEIDPHLIDAWRAQLGPDALPRPAELDELTTAGRTLLEAFARLSAAPTRGASRRPPPEQLDRDAVELEAASPDTAGPRPRRTA